MAGKTIDDLWKHIDARLDKQDQQREAIGRDVGTLTTDVAVLKKDGENDAKACEARHGSNRSRILRLEGGFIAVGVASFWALWKKFGGA